MHIYLAYARYTATSSNSFHEDRSSSRTISVPYVIQIFINIRLKWCVTRGTWTNRRHELLNVIIETKNDRTFRLTFESLSLSVSLSLCIWTNLLRIYEKIEFQGSMTDFVSLVVDAKRKKKGEIITVKQQTKFQRLKLRINLLQ